MKSPSLYTPRRGTLASISVLAATLLASSQLLATTGLIGRDWVKRNPLPTGDKIVAVVSGAPTTNPPVGGSRLIAVGAHGIILSSDDGTTWTPQSATRLKGTVTNSTKVATTITDDLNAVVFADGKYIAVGAQATWQELNGTTGKVDSISKVTIITSLDGLTWTDASADGSVNLLSVAAYTNQIVAVGGAGKSGATFFSDHGVIWRSATTAVSVGPMTQICKAGTNMYAVAPTLPGAILKGSYNGTTWTWVKQAAATGVAATDAPQSLVYTNSRFVLGTSKTGGLNLWTSSNGVNWTACTLGSTSPALAVSRLQWSGSEVLGVGAAGEFWKSSDGITFSALNRIPTGQPQLLLGAAQIGSKYVVTGEGGRIFSIAPPGESSWTSRYSTGTTADILGVASNGTGFVGVGDGFSVTSSNGVAWTSNVAAGKNLRSIAHTGSQYVTVGLGAYTSPDGVTFTETLTPTANGTLNRVVWTGSQLVAVGVTTAGLSQIQVSDTGATWTNRTLNVGSNQALNGAAFVGGLYVAVGNAGMVQTSPDSGLTWTKGAVKLAVGENFTDVVFGSNLFIATTNKGGIWTSANGKAWVNRKASSAGGFNRIVVAGPQIIAIGSGGVEAYSYGGLSWSEINAGTSQDMKDMAYGTSNLVAVGIGGSILSSTGGHPTRPTISFSTAAVAVSESVSGGTTALTLNISPAPIIPVTVVFALSGTATQGTSATSDYSIPVTVPPMTVTFPAGSTSQTITLKIKADTLDEVDETAIFTLGTPTGDATLGATSKLTLTIQDDDQVPTFTVQPLNTLTTVGTPVSLTATVAASGTITAPATLTGAWKKGAVAAAVTPSVTAVASPAGARFTAALAAAKLTDAGAYTVQVKNPSATTTSAVAELGVVQQNAAESNADGNVEKLADAVATVTVVAAGNGLSFQWTKGGVDIQNSTDGKISGVTTTKLTIKALDLGDIGLYACRVTQTTPTTTLTQMGGSAYLNVLTTVPVVTTTSLGTTAVAKAFSFAPAASGNPSKWTITGLPLGLDYDRVTGVITGQVKAAVTAGTDWPNIVITASNALGSSPPKTVTLHVDPLPANAVNTWAGLIARSAGNNNLGGRFDLTVANTGAFTGRIRIGSYDKPMTGFVVLNPAGTQVTLSSNMPADRGIAAFVVNVTIDPVGQTFIAQVVSGTDTALVDGDRTNLWATSPLTNSAGYYNFLISPPGTTTVATPGGFGYGTFTLTTGGTYTMSGKLADGQAFSTSGVALPTDTGGVTDIQVYQGMYAGADGSLQGTLRLTEVVNGATYENNRIGGGGGPGRQLTWYKPDQGTTIAESHPDRRSYGIGFGATPVNMLTTGGRYTEPAAPSIFCGLRPFSNNGKLQFFSSALTPFGGADVAITPGMTSINPNIVFTVTAPDTLTLPTGLVNNPASITMTLSAATGVFSGSFSLTEDDQFSISRTRTPSFFGMVVRLNGQAPIVNSTESLYSRGFFLLEKLPEAGLTGPTTIGPNGISPIQSGAVVFSRNL